MADYYEILSVHRNASTADIRKAYARLARERHPDLFSDPVERRRAEETFTELTAAFNTLSNDKSRQEYDASLERPHGTSPEGLAKEAYEKGLELAKARRYQESAEQLRQAVYLMRGEARYHALLGHVLARTPQGAREGVQYLEKAIELEPNRAAFHAQLSEIFLAQGMAIRARKSAETALMLDPHDRMALRVLEGLGPQGGEGGGLLGRLRGKP